MTYLKKPLGGEFLNEWGPWAPVRFQSQGARDDFLFSVASRGEGRFSAEAMRDDVRGAQVRWRPGSFLRLNDIYNLKLDAELVVLSACETALGREVRGEGLIGLTQGFMTAGARSVVASLWQVPDRATAELMRRFYGYMLDEGLAPAAALRKAQLASAAERRWSDPYFWGGFVLVGDWR